MSKEKIHIVITGGTIDAVWDPSKDTALPAQESILPSYFSKIKPDFDLTYQTVLMKDSRQLTPEDIRSIGAAVDAAPPDKVLVTHGTYTMSDTARYLEKNMKTNKSVVITGSVIPLRGYDMSDAPFNLGYALAVLHHMDQGVRIVMQGRVFTPEEVAKNMSEGRFFSIDELGKQ